MDIQLIDEILSSWQDVIKDDYEGYRNHVCRMSIFCLNLAPHTDDELKKICIAAAFHDIGIWIENTVDYIEPSIPPALEYLKNHGLDAWAEEISLMISEHHKLSPYTGKYSDLVERFRKADLVDFSLGFVRHGLPKSLIKEVKQQYPNQGFHISLLKKFCRWIIKNPLNPAPMMKR